MVQEGTPRMARQPGSWKLYRNMTYTSGNVLAAIPVSYNQPPFSKELPSSYCIPPTTVLWILPLYVVEGDSRDWLDTVTGCDGAWVEDR